jgi:hypothetical protein
MESGSLAPLAGLFASPAILFSLWLAGRYAKQRASLPRTSRVPAPTEKWPEGETADAVRLLFVVGILFVISASQVHFLDLALDSAVYKYGVDVKVAASYREMLFVWPPRGGCLFCDIYRFSHPKEGWTYFPPYESWLFLGLTIAVVVRFLIYLFKDLRIHRP